MKCEAVKPLTASLTIGSLMRINMYRRTQCFVQPDRTSYTVSHTKVSTGSRQLTYNPLIRPLIGVAAYQHTKTLQIHSFPSRCFDAPALILRDTEFSNFNLSSSTSAIISSLQCIFIFVSTSRTIVILAPPIATSNNLQYPLRQRDTTFNFICNVSNITRSRFIILGNALNGMTPYKCSWQQVLNFCCPVNISWF